MRLLLPALSWAICVAAAQRQRFAAVDEDNLVPRYLVDQSFPLARRAGICGQGAHSCEDIGFGGQCCENTRYCYVNRDGDAKCCPIGSNCLNQGPCSSDRYFCTVTPSPSAVTRSGATTTTTPTLSTACCARGCSSTSQYRCAPSLGGGCCGYDSECRADGGCVFPITVTTGTDGAGAALTPAADGCATSQYRCEDGAGCCDDDQRCTLVDGTGYCAPGRQTESPRPAGNGGGDLSDGAKVGIGVGSVVGAGIIIGGLTWLCLRRRRGRRQTLQPSEGSHVQQQQHQDHTAMTDITAASSQRPGGGTGPTRDYFGPDPVAGPYTTEVTDQSPASSPGHHRAVPSRPQQPGDIAAAVEMGSDDGRMSPASASQPNYFTAAVPIHAVEGTFELYSPQSDHPPPFSPSNAPPSPEGENKREGKF